MSDPNEKEKDHQSKKDRFDSIYKVIVTIIAGVSVLTTLLLLCLNIYQYNQNKDLDYQVRELLQINSDYRFKIELLNNAPKFHISNETQPDSVSK